MAFIDEFRRRPKLPPVIATIVPVSAKTEGRAEDYYRISTLLEYSFESSILIPSSSFSFSFAAPDDPRPITEYISEGDMVVLSCNDQVIATGLVESIQMEVQMQLGERITVVGRDLIGQWEDHDAVTLGADPMRDGYYTLQEVFNQLKANTRISQLDVQGISRNITQLFATTPGESKMTALTRFLEPINCVAWMQPNGRMIIGRPAFDGPKAGDIICSKEKKNSNVLSINVTYAAGRIPNVVVPIYSGQDDLLSRAPQGILVNKARKPNLLYQRGHQVIKTAMTSIPEGNTVQDNAEIGKLEQAGGNVNTLVKQGALRFFARANVAEMIVQAVVPRHLNKDGVPYSIDSLYYVDFDRGGVQELMYLYEANYTLSEEQGQRTNLFFCRLGTIVANTRAVR